jgi:hypothetical protein
MTLALAWVRKIRNCEELIVASDSRLSGARDIDCCQKILALPRTDSFICFAGDSQFAYPLMQQAFMAILSYERGRDRSLDLHDLRGHIIKVFNKLMESVFSSIKLLKTPDTTFLFGGYSWINKKFEVWIIRYSESTGRFGAALAPRWTSGKALIAIAGDWKHEARKRLIAKLRSKDITPQTQKDFHFDWEPFEILKELLLETNKQETKRNRFSIGGAPQIMKVYQHMNCRSLGVYWPSRDSNQIYIAGRKLLDYEKPDMWILDPDTCRSSHVLISQHDAIKAEE